MQPLNRVNIRIDMYPQKRATAVVVQSATVQRIIRDQSVDSGRFLDNTDERLAMQRDNQFLQGKRKVALVARNQLAMGLQLAVWRLLLGAFPYRPLIGSRERRHGAGEHRRIQKRLNQHVRAARVVHLPRAPARAGQPG